MTQPHCIALARTGAPARAALGPQAVNGGAAPPG
jgi:hypothetical protein